MNETREHIKDRMIRIAAQQWNVPENEIDSNFDPLLLLLFDAIANELESVGTRIKDIQAGLLQKLASTMLANALLQVKPGHCIITATPAETSTLLNDQHLFSVTTPVQKAGDPIQEKELYFTPIGNTPLINATLQYTRIGSKIYKIHQEGKKSLLHSTGDTEMTDILQLALLTTAPNLNGLQLYFDLKGHTEARSFYFALQHAPIYINNEKADTQKGYYKNNQYEINLKDAMSKENVYSRNVQKEVAALYQDQFITISEHSTISGNTDSFHQFADELPEVLQKEISQCNTFITIKLPRPFKTEALERLQVAINAFPVINRSLESVHFKTSKWINIVPLPVSGSYLDIHSIESNNGYTYKLHHASKENQVQDGEAIIRSARTGKASSSEVRSTIQNLLEVMRDESAFFSRISNDFVTTRLNDVAKILTRLEDQVQLSKNERPSFTYALLKPQNTGETVQVQYWVTSPQYCSSIKPGNNFKPHKHTLTQPGKTFSLTHAVGAMEELSEHAQQQLIVRQITSNGKIVSIEDVKLLCYQIFGNRLKQVTVQKNMKIMSGTKQGITKIIDIQLGLNKSDFSEEELVYLEKQLHFQLARDGCFMFPFEVSFVAPSPA